MEGDWRQSTTSRAFSSDANALGGVAVLHGDGERDQNGVEMSTSGRAIDRPAPGIQDV